MSATIVKQELARKPATFDVLLDQGIAIIRRIQIARTKLFRKPVPADTYTRKLDALSSTLSLIKGESELRGRGIQEQIKVVVALAKSLQDHLEDRVAQWEKDQHKYPNKILERENQEDRGLEVAIDELEQAKSELKRRIRTAPVGLSATLDSGYVVSLDTIHRVDRNVKSIFPEGLSIARWLEKRGCVADCNGQVPLSTQDLRDLGLFEKASWIENESHQYAELFNSDLSEFELNRSLERNFERNKAFDRSFLHNGRAKGEELALLMRVRREY